MKTTFRSDKLDPIRKNEDKVQKASRLGKSGEDGETGS